MSFSWPELHSFSNAVKIFAIFPLLFYHENLLPMQHGSQISHNNCIITAEVWKTHMRLQRLWWNNAILMWILLPCCMGSIFCLKQKWWTETVLSKYTIKTNYICNIWNARILMCAPSRERVKIHLQECSMPFSWIANFPSAVKMFDYFHHFSMI